MRVFVYYNLHKHCWSVKALEGPNKGRVIAHKDHVNLVACTFKVSQRGRERVLRERKKNVHAGVIGYLAPGAIPVDDSCIEITYNPYKYTTFVRKVDETCIEHAKYAFLSNRRVFIY